MNENTPQENISGVGNALILSIAAPIVSGLMFMAIFYLPIFGLALNFFAPLPLIYHFFTHGRRVAYIAIIAVSIMIAIASDLELAIFYIATHGLIAVITAEMILRKESMGKIIAWSGLIPLTVSAIFFLVTSPGSVAGIYEVLIGNTSKILQETVQAYTQAGVPPEQIDLLRENIENLSEWIVKLMPSTSLIAYIVLALGNYLAYKKIQKRFSFLPKPRETKLNEWYPPEKTVFALIIGGALSFLFSGFLGMVGANLLIITIAIYSLAGTSLMQFFIEKFRVPFFLRLLAYSLIIVQPVFLGMIAGFGLFDLWFDFRKIRENKDKEIDKN